jgi:hypothetical protein
MGKIKENIENGSLDILQYQSTKKPHNPRIME